MGNQRFLSRNATGDLVEFVAANGENYGMYEQYATSRGWKLYSPSYFHKWVWKNRDAVRAARVRHEDEVRKMGIMTKKRRVEILTAAAERLMAQIEQFDERFERMMEIEDDDRGFRPPSLDHYVKLEEQLRKTLEAIAKEQGEFNKGDEEDRHTGAEFALDLIARFKQLESRPRIAPVVDGEWEEVSS